MNKVKVENIVSPGSTRLVDAEKYAAMKRAYLAVVPKSAPGATPAQMLERMIENLPQDLFPDGAKAGWWAVNGELVRNGDGGDLMTVEQFNDFELRLEWKISENGNSGIMFHVATGDENPYESGPEYQILHNAGHKDGATPITSAGSNYAMHPPSKDVTRPVGEWNDIRLIVKGTHVEHWMNGVKLLEFEQFSPDWYARLKASKFAKMPPYGRHMRGHLVLQDHGALVTFRNIKIKAL